MAALTGLLLFSQLSHALYGGRPVAKEAAASAVVSLHLNDVAEGHVNEYFCSGVLVAADKILTTGHCVAVLGRSVYAHWSYLTYHPQLVRARAKGQWLEVVDVSIAPNYTEGSGLKSEDLAIIRLKHPVTTIKPLKLATKADLVAGKKVKMIAQGQMAESTIVEVRTKYHHTATIMDGLMSGVCQGDSGGALLIEKNKEVLLAGILSAHQKGCAKAAGLAIFPRLHF